MAEGRNKAAVQPEWARLARNELGRYYLAINSGYDFVDYQQEEIVPALEGLERGEYDRLMIFIHAGSAKTDLGTKAFIPWFLGKHPRQNVILLCHTDPLAKDFGSHIRNLMSRNVAHRQVFPELSIDPSNHAGNFFRTSRGNAFYSFGMDGGFTGRRADLLVIEDPIKNLADALSDTVQSSLHNIYKAVAKDRLRPGGRILFIMTRWAVRDIAGRILEEEGGRWRVLVIPAQSHNSGCLGGSDCVCPYLWESYFGRAMYDEAKGDQYIWEAKWQQSPKPALAQGFREEWLRFWLPEGAKPLYKDDPAGGPSTLIAAPTDHRKLYKHNTYVLVDPAMGTAAAHDRTCMLVLAAGPEGRLFLVDAVLDRLDPGERIDQFIKLYRLWKPKAVVWEEYALTADTFWLERTLKAQGIDLSGLQIISSGRAAIKGMSGARGGRLTKDDRILSLGADFRDGRIWLPIRLEKTLLDGTRFDIISYFVNKEYLPWAGTGSIAHDDMLDCLARIHEPELVFSHAERNDFDDDDEEYGGNTGGAASWESRY